MSLPSMYFRDNRGYFRERGFRDDSGDEDRADSLMKLILGAQEQHDPRQYRWCGSQFENARCDLWLHEKLSGRPPEQFRAELT